MNRPLNRVEVWNLLAGGATRSEIAEYCGIERAACDAMCKQAIARQSRVLSRRVA